jgi:hypothetical protein
MTKHDPKLLQELEEDRADRLAGRLSLSQIEAIANDTRLPGEIAGAYGVSAAVILRIQHKARAAKRYRETTARTRGFSAFLVGMLLALLSEAIA